MFVSFYVNANHWHTIGLNIFGNPVANAMHLWFHKLFLWHLCINTTTHGLQAPGEEIAFTARRKIKSQSQIFRYVQSIFCLPHRPKISDFFDLCLHWVSVVRATTAVYCQNRSSKDISWIRRCIEMQISLIVSYWLYLVVLRSKSVDISMYYIPEQCFLGLLNINYFFLLNLPNYILTIPNHVVFIFNSIQHVLNLHDCFTLRKLFRPRQSFLDYIGCIICIKTRWA